MRKLLLSVLIVVLCVSVVGTISALAASTKMPRVVFIVKGMQHPFWQKMMEGAELAGKDLGMEVTSRAPVTPYDVEEQIRIMEDAITQRVDAIVVVPADSRGIVPGIEKANAAKILVGTSNTKAMGGEVVGWAGADNFTSAYEVAKYLIKEMGNKGNLIILEGTPGNQTATDRKAGFDAAVKESNVKVLASQTANFVYEDGMHVMENLLQQFDNIDAVLAANDPMAIGAIQAMEAAGRLKGVLIGGFNGDDDAVDAIRKGKMVVTTAQVPESQAYWALIQIHMAFKGMPVPKEINVPTKMITTETVK
jgi:ribose transport system substrate-binding protein